MDEAVVADIINFMKQEFVEREAAQSIRIAMLSAEKKRLAEMLSQKDTEIESLRNLVKELSDRLSPEEEIVPPPTLEDLPEE